jgi:hypothetical protein
MRSKLVKVVLGCGFAAALVAPALACDFYKTSAQNEQPMAQSQQTTPDTPETAQSQPAPDTGSN